MLQTMKETLANGDALVGMVVGGCSSGAAAGLALVAAGAQAFHASGDGA